MQNNNFLSHAIRVQSCEVTLHLVNMMKNNYRHTMKQRSARVM